jgi:O-succinylbenzoic acid--CoA ligase
MSKTIPKMNLSKIEFLCENIERRNSILAFVDEWNNDKDFIRIKTSGSTGKPKEYSILKKYFIESARLTGEYFNFKAGEKIILALSIDTIGGKMQVIRAMLFDMKLLVFDNSRNPIKNLMEEVSFISLAPIQVDEIILKNKDKFKLIKNSLIGGAAISYRLEEKIKEISSNFYESYGMTETLSHIALRNIKNENCFKCLNGIEIRTKDSCLQITAKHLGIDELNTNDVVEIFSPQTFIVKGRKDFVINSGGFKFHPEIIEKKIARFLSTDFFISGEDNEEFGQIIIFIIEDKYSIKKMEVISEIFSSYLDKYEIPKKVYFIEEFIRTGSNKINRRETQNLIFDNK